MNYGLNKESALERSVPHCSCISMDDEGITPLLVSESIQTDTQRGISAIFDEQNVITKFSNGKVKDVGLNVRGLDFGLECSMIENEKEQLDEFLAEVPDSSIKDRSNLAVENGAEMASADSRPGKGLDGPMECTTVKVGAAVSRDDGMATEQLTQNNFAECNIIGRSTQLNVAERAIDKKLGFEAVGLRVLVKWPGYGGWFPGLVADFDPSIEKHFIEYDDGDKQWTVLSSKRVKLEVLESCAVDKMRLSDTDHPHQERLVNQAKRLELAKGGAKGASIMESKLNNILSKRVRLNEEQVEDEVRLSGTNYPHQAKIVNQAKRIRLAMASTIGTSIIESELTSVLPNHVDESHAEAEVRLSDTNCHLSHQTKVGNQAKRIKLSDASIIEGASIIESELTVENEEESVVNCGGGEAGNTRHMEHLKVQKSTCLYPAEPADSLGYPWLLRHAKVPTVGEEIVGSRIEVYWPEDKLWYSGRVSNFNSTTRQHIIHYDDGEKEVLNLSDEKYKLIEAEAGTCSGQDVIGLKLQVFWENLNTWLPGKVIDFNENLGKHLIEYQCGEQCWTVLTSKDVFELAEKKTTCLDHICHHTDCLKISEECDQQGVVGAMSIDPIEPARDFWEMEDFTLQQQSSIKIEEIEGNAGEDPCLLSKQMNVEVGHCLGNTHVKSFNAVGQINETAAMRKRKRNAACGSKGCPGANVRTTSCSQSPQSKHRPKNMQPSEVLHKKLREKWKLQRDQRVDSPGSTKVSRYGKLCYQSRSLHQHYALKLPSSKKVHQHPLKDKEECSGDPAIINGIHKKPPARVARLFPVPCLHPGCDERLPNVFELIKHRAEQHAVLLPQMHGHAMVESESVLDDAGQKSGHSSGRATVPCAKQSTTVLALQSCCLLKASTEKTQPKTLLGVGSSGFRGVSRRVGRKGWAAKYKAGKEVIHLGAFLCARRAALAWDLEARMHGRQDSQLNFPGQLATEAQVKLWRCKQSKSLEPTENYCGVSRATNSPRFVVCIDDESVLQFLGIPKPINIGSYAKEEDAAIAFDNVCRACGVPELELNFPIFPNICDSKPVTHVLSEPAAAKDSLHNRRLSVGDAVRARYLPDGRWYCAVVEDLLLDGSQIIVRWDDGDTEDTVKQLEDIELI